jgi:autotransporter-associated beta strand protein
MVLVVLCCGSAMAQRQMENLNRGLVAVRKNSTQVYLSWRLFGSDPANVAFNLYRTANGGAASKLNGSPITATTDYTDTPGSTNLTNIAYAYFVRPVINGVEQPDSEIAGLSANPPQKQFLTVPLRTDTGPNGPYTVKFCWVGDLDGDGDYDFIVDRLSTQGAYQQYLEAYKNDGTFLWRMAMGPNSVNQYAYEPGSSAISIGDTDNVTVYDMDGDGRAEVLVRTANGVTVTNAAGTQLATITAASNSTQFLSVIDGLSGAERARATLPNAWAVHGTLTNKAMVAYLDGKRPSVVMYGYNRADTNEFYRQFTAYDFRDGALAQRWTLPQTFPGAEGHQIRIADVDNDGKDEICDLGHVIDDNGTQLFHNELTHGDRFHIADINPDRPGLETFAIQQYNPTGLATALYESGTGSMIKKWYAGSIVDVGRGIALDINPNHQGYEMFSTQPGIYNAKGQQIQANNVWAPEGLWWDGDLGREFIDGAGSGALNPVINKFNPTTGNTDRLWTMYSDWGDYSIVQAYGGRPAFWGDILGDWREELVFIQSDFAALRIYTTTTPATNRIYTLMHNPQYRCQATTKGYVQSSYVDYYLGYGMPSAVPPPPMVATDLTWSSGTTWDSGSSAPWKNAAGAPSVFSSGNRVLFDVSGSNASSIALSGSLTPGAVSFFNPQAFTLNGTGSLAGAMTLSKSGAGTATLTGSHAYTGATTIWDGALVVNGQLSNTAVTVWGGTWGGSLARGQTGGRLSGNGTVSQPVIVEYRGAITPGAGMGAAGTLNLGAALTAKDGAVLALDLSADPSGVNDQIQVSGNLTLSGTVHLVVNPLNGQLAPGTYTLLTYGGSLSGSLSNIALALPEGTAHTLTVGSGAITLTIPVTRAPAALTWTGGNGGNAWDIANTVNWSRSGTADTFVASDTVTFDSTGAANPVVNLTNSLPVGGIVVSSETDYQLTGPGSITGSGGLTKTGGGTLTLQTTNNYSGPTLIHGGTLAVDNLGDGGAPSSLGSSGTAASNLVLNGGTLALSGEQTSTNRSVTLGSSGGTFSVPGSKSLQISGQLTGTGTLTKTAAGTLILAAPNNYSGGTSISDGKIFLASDSANVSALGSGGVTLNGGTLSMTNSTDGSAPVSAWPIHVPTGFSGRLDADGRCTLAGALTGGGEFTFYTPFVRTALTGNWSAFTGRIWVIADGDGGDLRIENPAGYPSARLNLGNGVYAYYNLSMGGNLTIPVGTLFGSTSAFLRGGPTSGRTLTWQVGARNEDSTFAGVIGNSTGPSALTKVGAGTLTLTGANTYSGATTVSGGRLQINGSSSATNYTVQNGATLGGSGSITGNVTVQTGGALEHGASGAASLAITGNLTLPSSVVVRPAAGAAAAGSYTVLTYSGTLTGTPTFTWEAPAGLFLVASFNTSTAGVISMTLAAPLRLPGSITWTGAASFNWDTATQNWTAGSAATHYQTGDTPWFTDSGVATSAISIVANVQPAGVVVNAAKNYTFSGSGAITGDATLVKSGSGALTLTGIHGIGGVTSISGGTLSITQTGGGSSATGAVLGSGPIELSGGGTFRMGSSNGKNFPSNPITVPPSASGTLSSATLANVYGGSLTGAADSVLTLSGPVSMGVSGSEQLGLFLGTVIIPTGSQLRFSSTSGPNGNGGSHTTFQVDGIMNTRDSGGSGGAVLGALTGGGSLQGQSNTPSGTVVYHVGSKNLDSTFSGTIANSSNGTVGLNKTGSGNLTLSGSNTYTGATTVASGKLTVTGSLAATATSVGSSGILGGTGTIAGFVTCNGTLAPGTSAGTLTLGAGLALASTSTLRFDLGTTSDLTAITGNLALDGTLHITATAGFAAGTYTLITYTGSLTNNTLNLGTLPDGYIATVNTATAGQVRLVVSPSNSAPQITSGPVVSETNITTSTVVSVTATDDAGEGSLTYTWSATGPAAVSFSPNATNSAKNATATFTAPGSYTLTVTVTDGPGLFVENSIMIISPRSITSWETAKFTPEQIQAGESAPDADPDRDGLSNLAEYALGGDPHAFNQQPAVGMDTTSVTITFQRPAWIGDVTYHAEAGGDFMSWEQLALEILTAPGSDPETVRATYLLPNPAPGRCFIRLRFEKQATP